MHQTWLGWWRDGRGTQLHEVQSDKADFVSIYAGYHNHFWLLISVSHLLCLLFSLLCKIHFENLFSGETTCERFSGSQSNYRFRYKNHKKEILMCSSTSRMSNLSVNDDQNYEDLICCTNPISMCCNSSTLSQDDLVKTIKWEYETSMRSTVWK